MKKGVEPIGETFELSILGIRNIDEGLAGLVLSEVERMRKGMWGQILATFGGDQVTTAQTRSIANALVINEKTNGMIREHITSPKFKNISKEALIERISRDEIVLGIIPIKKGLTWKSWCLEITPYAYV